ncbi:MAG: bacterioferritin [Acidimicrobiia bacterium]
MQGDPEVIEMLNEVLTAELTAINQYFIDARMCANWGYDRLAERLYNESIGEMKDAQALIDRILYLDGLPNVQRLGAVRVGENPQEKLELALSLETEAIERLNRAIGLCEAKADAGSRELLTHILEGEEEGADWLETQLHAIGELGAVAYLAEQLH